MRVVACFLLGCALIACGPEPRSHPVAPGSALAPAAWVDDFTSPLAPTYVVTAPPELAVVVMGGLLKMVSTGHARFAIGQVVLAGAGAPRPGEAFTARTRIRLARPAGHEGSTARLQVVDGERWINLGMVSAMGAAYQVQRGAGQLEQTVLRDRPADEAWHMYELAYDGERATLSMDGERVAVVPLRLEQPQVWLQTHTRHDGLGQAQAEFDELWVSK